MLLEPKVEALLIFRGRNELYNKGIKISIIIFKLVFFLPTPVLFINGIKVTLECTMTILNKVTFEYGVIIKLSRQKV